MVIDTLKGALVASAVAALFTSTLAFAEGKAKPKEGAKIVKCGGVNECKGKGSCAGADNACKSQNSCKGKSFMETKSEKECTDMGGKILAAK